MPSTRTTRPDPIRPIPNSVLVLATSAALLAGLIACSGNRNAAVETEPGTEPHATVEPGTSPYAAAEPAPSPTGEQPAVWGRVTPMEPGERGEALKQILSTLEANPEDPEALNEAGKLSMQEGRFPDAMKYFERAMKTGKAPQETPANLGQIYAQMGRLTEAIHYWEQAVAQDPDTPLALLAKERIEVARDRLKKDAFRPK
jgi:tetratricopeptide (TPR) repeat protein